MGFTTCSQRFFLDVAEANQYRVVLMCIEDLAAFKVVRIPSRDAVYSLVRAKQLPENGLHFTVLIKDSVDRPFRVPMQGYYQKTLSNVGLTAWRELR